MFATLLQLVGLGAFVSGVTVEFGVSGALIGGGISLVYVGLAMERD